MLSLAEAFDIAQSEFAARLPGNERRCNRVFTRLRQIARGCNGLVPEETLTVVVYAHSKEFQTKMGRRR